MSAGRRPANSRSYWKYFTARPHNSDQNPWWRKWWVW